MTVLCLCAKVNRFLTAAISFMSLCKSKQISNCCHPNALMTLMEYLQDYASPETKKVGLELIQKELENIPGEKIRKLTEEHLADIVNGQRDFRF